ncbi:hypothetical protein [Sulfitobacter sp.]|uniref:hypothetical protein n=1 Tax=Sulfitobacter sp. TaxID=1903071 RepID=UPI00356B484C
MFAMNVKSAIISWVKVAACLALAISLVLFPPSAAHAASGVHGGHHSKPVIADSDISMHGQDHQTSGTEHDAELANTDDEISAGNCCSGICISVVLNDSVLSAGEQVPTDRLLMPDAQARSIDASGFLRPPQFLI